MIRAAASSLTGAVEQAADAEHQRGAGVGQQMAAFERPCVGSHRNDRHSRAQPGDDRDHGVEGWHCRHGDHLGAPDLGGERVGTTGEARP
jgi:hypothetical protein